MTYDLWISNALIVEEHGVWRGNIGVRNGLITTLTTAEPDGPTAELLDAGGRPVLPGLIDVHVHFNQPGRTEWEGFTTGSMAAAAGGVTTVIDMPLNCAPAIIDGVTLHNKIAALEGQSLVDYALWGGLVEDNVAQLAGQDTAGALAYKAFMSNSGIDDFVSVSDGVLLAGLAHAAHSGRLVAVHAENDALTAYLAAQLRAQGRIDRRAWLESRPPLAEVEAISRALLLARHTGARLHIVHVSTPEGIDLVQQARAAGQPVTCETCPHYLVLDEEDFEAIGPVAKCAPPLRPRAAVEGLWQRLLSGEIDLVASDHSPCPTTDKTRGADDIWAAWGGISGVQTMLPLLLHEGVHRRGMPLPLLARLTSANPARIFGLAPSKGSLRPGADADCVILDPDVEWEVTPQALHARHSHSPFLGWRLRGCVRTTLVRGQVVYDQGMFRVQPGHGRLLLPA
ncbi:MAG: allantoinase [Roseiflexaceae bacterium]